jgi:hypothetical protein
MKNLSPKNSIIFEDIIMDKKYNSDIQRKKIIFKSPENNTEREIDNINGFRKGKIFNNKFTLKYKL